MIKKLKNFFCNLFGIKQCACVPVYEDEEAVKKEHCDGHLRFRKSCPLCQELVK
tara:strand:- start:42 stop:203 length:162 start_codon:yes stop_codon:yes gene_type:complete